MASLSSSMLTASHCSVLSVHLLRCKTLCVTDEYVKYICAGVDSHRKPLIAGFHLDIEPLTVAYWMQISIQFHTDLLYL